jgi:hypothetical protein
VIEKSPSPEKKEFNFNHKETPAVLNSATNKGAEDKAREFNERMEKYVWSCVPDKKLY